MTGILLLAASAFAVWAMLSRRETYILAAILVYTGTTVYLIKMAMPLVPLALGLGIALSVFGLSRLLPSERPHPPAKPGALPSAG